MTASSFDPATDRPGEADGSEPFQWLEGDVHADSLVRAWVEQQSQQTTLHLAALPRRAEVRRCLEAIWAFEKLGCPVRRGDRYFHEWNSGLTPHNIVVVQEGLGGVPVPVLDPNAMGLGQGDVVRDWSPSGDGTRLAYTLQRQGGDDRTLHVLAVDGRRIEPDVLQGLKAGQFAWHPDNRRIFYTRFEAPPTAQAGAPAFRSAIHCHRLGMPQADDILVFDGVSGSGSLHIPRVSDDSRWLVVTSTTAGGTKADVRVQTLAGPAAPMLDLVAGFADRWSFVGGGSDGLVFMTDRDAPLGRLVVLDPSAGPSQAPRTVVPEAAHAIRGVTLAGTEIVVLYQNGLDSVLRRFERQGDPIADVALPRFAVVDQLRGHVDAPELFFRVSSAVQAPEVWRCDLQSGAVSVFRSPQACWDPDQYVVRQIFATSDDGTQIPVTLAHARRLDLGTPQPTALMVYGGFGISPELSFWESRFGWMALGGVFAIAHTRGGAEYGSRWADAARKGGRLLVVADYLAAARALGDSGIASQRTLVALGASNGGLMVAAVINARPEVFAVALCRVPVTDLLRYTRFTLGRIWVDELGDPDLPSERQFLLAYSPLHNVRSGAMYPAILVTTADADDRVVPSHSFKYVAALQAATIGPGPHLIRIETNAGHGEGKSADRLIDEFTDLWTFALSHVRLDDADDQRP